jgi:hypothetical protein
MEAETATATVTAEDAGATDIKRRPSDPVKAMESSTMGNTVEDEELLRRPSLIVNKHSHQTAPDVVCTAGMTETQKLLLLKAASAESIRAENEVQEEGEQAIAVEAVATIGVVIDEPSVDEFKPRDGESGKEFYLRTKRKLSMRQLGDMICKPYV